MNDLVKKSSSVSNEYISKIGINEVLHIFDSYKFKAGNYRRINGKFLSYIQKIGMPLAKPAQATYLQHLTTQGIKNIPAYKTPINKLLKIAKERNFYGASIFDDTNQSTVIENQLGAYFEAFLQMDKGKPKSDQTKVNYRASFKEFAKHCEATNINQFTYLSVRKYADKLNKEMSEGAKSNFTVNTYLAPLRQFAKYLIWDSHNMFGQLPNDERAQIERDLNKISLIANQTIDKQKYYKDSLTHSEVIKVIEAATNAREKLIIALMYFTGLRSFEVLRVWHNSFNWKAQQLTIIGKGSKKATIPLDHCIDALRGYHKAYISEYKPDLDGLLFPSINNTATIRTFVNKLLNKLDLKEKKQKVSCHSFRHSLVQNLLLKGLPVEVVQTIARHTNLSTTEMYFKKLQTENRLSIPKNLLDIPDNNC